MPPANLIIQGVLAAIQAAPQVIEVVTSAKNFIASLVGAKVISVAQQDAVHAFADAQEKLLESGYVPPAWTVEPDPGAPPITMS
jgi:hypothetical protein